MELELDKSLRSLQTSLDDIEGREVPEHEQNKQNRLFANFTSDRNLYMYT